MLNFFGKNSISLPKGEDVTLWHLLTMVGIALACNIYLLSSPLYRGTYDAYIHMFFAAHYRSDWLETWDNRWYGGYDLASYPPLVHQVVAILGKKIGILAAYKFTLMSCFPLFTIGVYRYAKCWVSKKAALHAGFASIFATSIGEAAYQWGQLPTLFATGFLLLGLAHFHEWKTNGNKISFYMAATALLVTLTAHHLTIVFGFPVFAFALVVEDINASIKTKKWTPELKRSFQFFAFFAAAGLLCFSPFLWFVQGNQVTQVPIKHASRNNFIEDFQAMFLFWLIPWGALLCFIPTAVLDSFTNRRRAALGISVLLFTLLGLGGTFPLFKVLLGPMFNILTFDRFTLWATIAILPFVGQTIMEAGNRLARTALYSTLVVGYFSYFLWLKNYQFQPPQFPLRPIIEVLEKEAGPKHRYLTLGFGSQLAWLSTFTTSTSVDGLYHTVRSDATLRESGIEALDGAKYFGDVGMRTLKHYLVKNRHYNLRVILSADPFYDQALKESGWHQLNWIDKLPVATWVKDPVPEISQKILNTKSKLPVWAKYIHAAYPLILALYAGMWFVVLYKRKPKSGDEIHDEGEMVRADDIPPVTVQDRPAV